MNRRRVAFVWLVVLAVGSAACGGGLSASNRPQPATGYASVLDHLRAAGLGAEPGEEVEQPFLAVTGRMIQIRGEDVQVFTYPDPAAASAQAARISLDGTTVGTAKIHWIGPPHFYKQGALLVLYVGDDAQILRALESALGRPFAGQ